MEHQVKGFPILEKILPESGTRAEGEGVTCIGGLYGKGQGVEPVLGGWAVEKMEREPGFHTPLNLLGIGISQGRGRDGLRGERGQVTGGPKVTARLIVIL